LRCGTKELSRGYAKEEQGREAAAIFLQNKRLTLPLQCDF